MRFIPKLKQWITNPFRIYLPHDFKVPLTWFALSVFIGIAIQSVRVKHLVIVDFFSTTYIQWLNYLSMVIDGTYLFGFGVLFSFLLQSAYYLIATVSLGVLLFRLIMSLDNPNSRKILGWLVIFVFLGFSFRIYAPNVNLDLLNSEQLSEYNGCPDGIIPEVLTLNIVDFPGLPEEYKGLDIIKQVSKWKDSQPIEDYIPEGSVYLFEPACKAGSSEGQNVNDYYCNNLKYSKSITPISEEGVIGKTQNSQFVISLVLTLVPNQNLQSEEVNFQRQKVGDFEVISAQCKPLK
ncbi:hypothetical protein HZB02_01175 [Candidatus Woesearchaeota archaeon]|nr:hypothetical protein [Candidatus Woesearchaeota archaeon]